MFVIFKCCSHFVRHAQIHYRMHQWSAVSVHVQQCVDSSTIIPTYEMNALASRMVVMLDVLNDIGLAVLYVLWQYFVIFVRFKFQKLEIILHLKYLFKVSPQNFEGQPLKFLVVPSPNKHTWSGFMNPCEYSHSQIA